jgi:type IV conjugative transfer system protein TraL
MSHDQFSFPKDIDEPPMVMFWEIPHFIASVMPIGVGIVLRDGFVMLGCVFVTYYCLKYFKRMASKAKRNEMKHAAYAIGLPGDKSMKNWELYKDYTGG